MNTAAYIIGLCLAGIGSALAAGDESQWPRWRGPLANGVAPQGNPPITWSETSNVKWKVKTPGQGTGSPIIWGSEIFLQTAIPTGKKIEAPAQAEPAPVPPAEGQGGDRRRNRGPGGGGRGEKPTEFHQFALVCLDRETGKTKWQKVAKELVPHEGHHRDHGFASFSPVTDGKHLIAFFGSRGLYCYDLNGELKWEKDLGQMRTRAGFGEGCSPALHGNTVVVNWDHEGEDFIAAFDKETGKELWRNKRDEATTWTTPLIVTHEGKPQVVVSASTRVRAYDLASGQEVWQCGGMTGNVIPTPVTDFGMVYAISGFRGAALLAIKLGKSGDLTDSAEAIAWRHDKRTPYVPSPLLYGDKLYFSSGNDAILSCFDAKSGKPHFEAQRLEGPNGLYASPVGASGRVYLAGRNGTSLVLKNADKFEILATNTLDDKFDASPALAGKELYLRGHESLYCLAEK